MWRSAGRCIRRRRSTWAATWTPAPTRRWSSCSTTVSWSRPPPPAAPGGGCHRPVRPRPRRIPGHPADPHPRQPGGDPMTTTIRDPVSPDLRKTLRALKLGQMLATLPERLTLARQQKMAHADFLELVLADEHARRETKSASLRARAAGLDHSMRLDTWDETAAVTYDRQLWND